MSRKEGRVPANLDLRNQKTVKETPRLISYCAVLQEKKIRKALRACFTFNCPPQVNEGNVFLEDETVHFIDNSQSAC